MWTEIERAFLWALILVLLKASNIITIEDEMDVRLDKHRVSHFDSLSKMVFLLLE